VNAIKQHPCTKLCDAYLVLAEQSHVQSQAHMWQIRLRLLLWSNAAMMSTS
jgi:hypothetical protein